MALGVFAGLVVGKPLGIMLAAVLAVKVGRVRLPAGAGWVELLGVGLLAGIGFTVSLFVTGLAFTDPALQDQAKIGILAASTIAGILGALILRRTSGRGGRSAAGNLAP